MENYTYVKDIGEGGYGKVIHAKCKADGTDVAIKIEKPVEGKHRHLQHEYNIYKKLDGTHGIPRMKEFCEDGKSSILVMELIGSSLQALFFKSKCKFSLDITIYVLKEILKCLESVHKHGVVHGDIKPDNLLVGRGAQQNALYLIDFGLARRYKDETTDELLRQESNSDFNGTAMFASLNAHRVLNLGPRDDLESLTYMVIYFLKGRLPWQILRGATRKQRLERVAEIKASVTVAQLCQDLPNAFTDMVTYCRSLDYTDRINFHRVQDLFKSEVVDRDIMLDWSITLQALPDHPRTQAAKKQGPEQQKSERQ